MLRTRLEHHLNNHTSQKELEDALNMFICYNVPDNGEKKKAEDKLKQYWEIKKGMSFLYARIVFIFGLLETV